jgi:cytochrome c5
VKILSAINAALIVITLILSVNVHALTEKTKLALVERIIPIGQACEEGNPKCAVAVNEGEPRSGDVVYTAACQACHATGAAGAPILGDASAWGSRIGKGKVTLYSSAISGIGAMPAKGGCTACSDAEIQAAVDYMIKKSR